MFHFQLEYVVDDAGVSPNCCQQLVIDDPSIQDRSEVAFEVTRLYDNFHEVVRIVAGERFPSATYIISELSRL